MCKKAVEEENKLKDEEKEGPFQESNAKLVNKLLREKGIVKSKTLQAVLQGWVEDKAGNKCQREVDELEEYHNKGDEDK